jgi:hypothetical protein
MGNDRDYMVDMLCRQILGMRETDGQRPRGMVDDAAGAKVSIELQGMVKTIRRQLWIDNASYTKRVQDEITEQASRIDLQAEIAKSVKREIDDVLRQLASLVRTKVQALVSDEIHRRIGGLPARIARKLTKKVWDDAFKDGL